MSELECRLVSIGLVADNIEKWKATNHNISNIYKKEILNQIEQLKKEAEDL